MWLVYIKYLLYLSYLILSNLIHHRHNRDGKNCVLKALCETGQRYHERGSGTFVGEIMRAIFSLPKIDGAHKYQPNHENHIHYDIAHGHGLEANCDKLYPQCKDSIWSADFIF